MSEVKVIKELEVKGGVVILGEYEDGFGAHYISGAVNASDIEDGQVSFFSIAGKRCYSKSLNTLDEALAKHAEREEAAKNARGVIWG